MTPRELTGRSRGRAWEMDEHPGPGPVPRTAVEAAAPRSQDGGPRAGRGRDTACPSAGARTHQGGRDKQRATCGDKMRAGAATRVERPPAGRGVPLVKGAADGLHRFADGQAGRREVQPGRGSGEGVLDGVAVGGATEHDDVRVAAQLEAVDLLAQDVEVDRLGLRALESDVIRAGDGEVRGDEAVPGAEDEPGVGEAFGVRAVEGERGAGVRVPRGADRAEGSGPRSCAGRRG